jgi:hypothetical protein
MGEEDEKEEVEWGAAKPTPAEPAPAPPGGAG